MCNLAVVERRDSRQPLQHLLRRQPPRAPVGAPAPAAAPVAAARARRLARRRHANPRRRGPRYLCSRGARPVRLLVRAKGHGGGGVGIGLALLQGRKELRREATVPRP